MGLALALFAAPVSTHHSFAMFDLNPKNVVTIGSEVTFIDDTNGTTRTVRLVLPGEADIEEARVSVMTPVGAGLIGMSIGREISWPLPDGRPRALKILDVKQHS